MNSRCFKLYRSYSISFNSSDVGEFYFNSIVKDCIKVQKKKKEVVVLCSRSVQNVKLREKREKVQKNVMHVQSCCFANLRLLYFFFAVFVAVVVLVA